MSVTPEEARKSLDEIRSAAERTSRTAAYAGADVLFILWGVIWALGYGCTYFLPTVTLWVWTGLDVIGIASTIWVGMRYAAVKSGVGKRIGFFWFLLYVYVNLWIVMLWPFLKVQGHEQSMDFWKHISTLGLTVPMFAFVVVGLWLEHMMIWIGLAVTALAAAGLYLIPLPYFWLYLGVAAGGTLIGTGLFARRRWKGTP